MLFVFKVRSTTREVFVIDVMEAKLANHGVFTRWHAKMQRLNQHNIGGPMGSHPPLVAT